MNGKHILREASKLYLESHLLGETDARFKKKKKFWPNILTFF